MNIMNMDKHRNRIPAKQSVFRKILNWIDILLNRKSHINPRPTFAPNSEPMLVWNEVVGATSYKFKMVNQTTQELIWEIELTSTSSGVEHENNDLKYNYPTGKPPLEQNSIYLLIGETYEGKSLLQSQLQLVLLEEPRQQAVEDFESLLDFDNQGELEEKWLMAKKALLVFDANSFRFGRPWRNCLEIYFK